MTDNIAKILPGFFSVTLNEALLFFTFPVLLIPPLMNESIAALHRVFQAVS